MSRLEETVNSDPGLTERLRTMEARISQLQVRSENTTKKSGCIDRVISHLSESA